MRPAPDTEPAISVAVASHRPLRLRWLLNALEEQATGERFEVVVAHDGDPETEALVAEHPLATGGRLRALRFAAGSAPSVKRNAAWRAASAPLVAFTDDDCRPDPGWLTALLAAAATAPGAVVQGATRPDPLEAGVFAAPHVRTVVVEPPGQLGQTCNIAYPRTVLERLGGFAETFPQAAGEDTDLWLRARALRVALAPAPGAVVFHAVEANGLVATVRGNLRWRHVIGVVARHPEGRSELVHRLFLRQSHEDLLLAAAGVAGARRAPVLALLAAPYLRRALGARGTGPRARAVAAAELPGRVAVDAAEVATMAWGSVTYGTLVL